MTFVLWVRSCLRGQGEELRPIGAKILPKVYEISLTQAAGCGIVSAQSTGIMSFTIQNVEIGGKKPFYILGPCSLESEEFAWEIEVSPRLVYDYEDGFKRPRLEKAILISEVLSVSLDDMFL